MALRELRRATGVVVAATFTFAVSFLPAANAISPLRAADAVSPLPAAEAISALTAAAATSPAPAADGRPLARARARLLYEEGRNATARVASHGPYPRPSWWSGPCDVGHHPGSHRLTAIFDGLQSCGPGPNQGGADYLVQFFRGAWGEYEWECVELSMRWMYLAWGVKPYGANGNGVVSNYPNGRAGYPRLIKVSNGTRNESPVLGDVISIDNSDSDGHTEVIAATSVNSSGNGLLRAITDNWDAQSNGWVMLSVKNWVVSDGVPGNRVIGWLHNPAWKA